MLDALWPLLAPGGRLLYATCSVFKAEGQEPDRRFFATPRRRLPPGSTRARPGICCRCPTIGQPRRPARPPLQDGFFYALIHKT